MNTFQGINNSSYLGMAANVPPVCEPAAGRFSATAGWPEPQPVVLCAVAIPVIAGLATDGKVGNGLIPQNLNQAFFLRNAKAVS